MTPREERLIVGRRAGLLLVIAAALVLGAASCGGTRACKQGTIFVQVHADSLSGAADGVLVDVAVSGRAPVERSFPLSGSASGGIEIQFAGTYPAGQDASVQVTLQKDGTPVAQRTLPVTVAPGCTSLIADFGADAGVDQGSGGAGLGGNAAGGAAGTSSGGEGGGGIGGGGRSGNLGGAGGATGGAGGHATGGAGGRMTGGAPGGGGKDGKGGAGGGSPGGKGGAAGGAGGGCVRAGPEDCFNQIDDDCNGHIDCDDPACTSGATCVAVDPSVGSIGTSVDPAAACPAAASMARTLISGTDTSTCSGQCACGQGTATLSCSASIYEFSSAPECADATDPGQAAYTLTSADGCHMLPAGASSVSGIRVAALNGTPIGKCQPMATNLVKGPPVWTASTKFCGLSAVGAGCGATAACIPRAIATATAGACVLLAGAQTCPSGLHQTDWYSSAVDSRTCACNCGTPTGGTCNSVLIEVTDQCGGNVQGYASINNDRLCLTPALATPGLQLNGTPIAPTCQSSIGYNGSLTLGGQQTLCCP